VSRYLRETRRPVRRATLRDPGFSFLLVVVNAGWHGQLAAAVPISCSSLASSAGISEPVTSDYPGDSPWAFTGGTTHKVIVNVAGDPWVDLEKEVQAAFARD
jgi:hypothetical protein